LDLITKEEFMVKLKAERAGYQEIMKKDKEINII